jgi:RNA polymerase-binding transcription factor DksA
MRQHFHRCPNLRVVSVAAEDLGPNRGRGTAVLDELCAARKLSRCVGLAECDELPPAQKRELLVARVTRLREEQGAASAPLGDVDDARWQELTGVAADLVEERREILEENRRLVAEATAAADWGKEQSSRASEGFAAAGVTSHLDEPLRALRLARLDAIDRALDAFAQGDPRACVRCRRPIEVGRLRDAPDAWVCAACAETSGQPETPT